MIKTAESFIRFLDEKNISYETFSTSDDYENDNAVQVSYPAESGEIDLTCFFSENHDVQVRCFSLCNVPNDKIEEMYEVLNELNSKYRWVTFFIDDDNDVNVKGDLFSVTNNTAGYMCSDFMLRIINIIDDALPDIMKARWS